MGYTQYWDHKGFTDEQWKKLVTFTRNLISDTKVPIVNGEGDESCETFNLTKAAQDFEFCKTRQFPYDEVVVAIMREAMEINPTFNPRSDGGWAVFGDVAPRTVMGYVVESRQ